MPDDTPLDPADVTVVAAMENEARPVRRWYRSCAWCRGGIGLAEMGAPPHPVAFSVGLAGGFDPSSPRAPW